MMAVVASVFSTVAAVLTKGGRSKGTNIPVFAGAQLLGGVLMLLFFAVVSWILPFAFHIHNFIS